VTIAAPDQLLVSNRGEQKSVALAQPPLVAAPVPPPPVRLRDRVLRFLRSLFVGAWASALDFAVLLLCIRLFALEHTVARVIALAVSGVVLFFGNRSFAFHAQAGSISRQARLFVLSEFVGAVLNVGVFRLLVSNLPVLPPEALGQAANFLVFITFYYPVRSFVVFRVTPRR
jgi:putative flippase GtrA